MMNTPIYRAKRLDNGEYVEGMLYQDGRGHYQITNYLPPMGYGYRSIDPSTLAISFDNSTWFDMENADRAFREYSKTHGYEGSEDEAL